MKKLLLIIAASCSFLLPGDLWSQIYMYEDAHGVRHYTNVPTSSRYKPVKLRGLNNEPRRRPVPVTGKYSRGSSGNSAMYENHISRAALTHELDPLLIKAIIKAESDFNQYAVSSSGAQGLMQLMPETARDMRVDNPFDPLQNINGGTRYFKNLLNIYDNDLTLSLAAYNAGPGKVAINGPLPRIRETREYVQRVIRFYRSYQQTAPAERSKKIKVRKLLTAN
ncbi:MAG: lytic transglycosylase domain-containing protein [Desulfobulbaceae bacterium]|nr:lytic transglycosylase domain-containing protein [Desulfobulbaceae bacterium]